MVLIFASIDAHLQLLPSDTKQIQNIVKNNVHIYYVLPFDGKDEAMLTPLFTMLIHSLIQTLFRGIHYVVFLGKLTEDGTT